MCFFFYILHNIHSVHFDFTLQQCLYSVMNWLKQYWDVRKQHAHTLLYKLNIADKACELFYKLMEAERLREGTKFLMCKAGIYACVQGAVLYTLKLNEEDRKYFLDDRDYGLYTACNRLCVGWLDTTEVSVGFLTWEGKSRSMQIDVDFQDPDCVFTAWRWSTNKTKNHRTASLFFTSIHPFTTLKLILLSIMRSRLNVALDSGVRTSTMWINTENGERGKSLTNTPVAQHFWHWL